MNALEHLFDTPLGPMRAVLDGTGALVSLEFADGARPHRAPARTPAGAAGSAARSVEAQVTAYFKGERRAFDLPLAPRGTPFQRRTWRALLRIPYGTTVSYGDLARRLGSPGASRAVGRANATNPIAVVVPCHRVIGSDGTMTGYGGGVERKRRLLELERSRAAAGPAGRSVRARDAVVAI